MLALTLRVDTFISKVLSISFRRMIGHHASRDSDLDLFLLSCTQILADPLIVVAGRLLA